MRRWIPVCLLLLAPLRAYANPIVINPGSIVSFWVVAVAALAVEAGIVALLLAFQGLNVVQVFAAFFSVNVAVFVCVFLPLLQRDWLAGAAELVVVSIDCLAIKLLAGLDLFQGENYTGLSWWRALVVSAFGNAASCFIGYLAGHTYWQIG